MSGVEHERGGLMEARCSGRREDRVRHVTVRLHVLTPLLTYLEISLKSSSRQAVVLPACLLNLPLLIISQNLSRTFELRYKVTSDE